MDEKVKLHLQRSRNERGDLYDAGELYRAVKSLTDVVEKLERRVADLQFHIEEIRGFDPGSVEKFVKKAEEGL